MLSSLQHVTLDTNHAHQSQRSEVRDDALAELRPLIVRALRGERVPLPGPPGYQLSGGTDDGTSVVLTIAAADRPDDGGLGGTPLAMVGIAPPAASRASAERVWRALLRQQAGPRAEARILPCPEAPWCGVRLVPFGLLAHPAATAWIGDLERCLAWAWIEEVADHG